MILFHLSVMQVQRSAEQSVSASTAYRAGERLYSERYGEYSDYTHKRGKDAQLAYSFDIALQNEFLLEEKGNFFWRTLSAGAWWWTLPYTRLIRRMGESPTSTSMSSASSGPFWKGANGAKGYVYRLDEDGNRILEEKGKPLFDATPPTDWGHPETLKA